eukprot:CAMPEP_0198117160 /NCGR_PEP_ID=MMETSP1442-20131203/16723_1 /TAXON_ID= /ORGANISM="Craspedostauros australis, Strain CCMP3328" /LENGTH=171 /DNA_ID=CAMNT_0043775147 /DNA_START=109 /DNA_END=624 /DNA_ORIENTATION=-
MSTPSSTSTRRSSSISSGSSAQKRVHFGDITIVTYPMILGDNPAVSEGAPIQMDWEAVDTVTQSMELYEYIRNNDGGSKRRRGKKLQMSTEKRGRIVLQAGYSLTDIANAVMEVEAIKKSRAESLTKADGWERLGLLLKNTGKLPKDIISGVVSAGRKIMPKQKSFRARSA